MAPDRHSMSEMHRSTVDSSGANVTSGYVPKADGSGGVAWGAVSGGSSIYFNVMDYGATGDGVTNDRVAINAAIAAAAAVGGGVAYFPHGSYLVGTPGLVGDPEVTLLGESRESSILLAGANTINIVTITGVVSDGTHQGDRASPVINLQFDANGYTGCNGVSFLYVDYFTVDRCLFNGAFVRGVDFYGSLQGRVDDSMFLSCATGINFSAQTSGYMGVLPPNRVEVTWCVFYDNTAHAIDFSGGAQIFVQGCEFGNNGTVADATTSAVYFHGALYNNAVAAGIDISDCWFEGNVGLAGVVIGASVAAYQHSIRNTYFPTNDATYAVEVDGSSGAQTLVTSGLRIATAASTRGIHGTGSAAHRRTKDTYGVASGAWASYQDDPLLDGTAVVDESGMLALRLPNLTTTARDAIAAPTAGMVIWNTTTSAVNQYTGAAWAAVGSASFATPAIVLGTAAAAGAAATVIRSDSTIVAFDATVPTTIAAADAAAAGSAAVAARRDHRHGAPASFGGEVIMTSGIVPPDPVLNSAGDDWVYSS